MNKIAVPWPLLLSTALLVFGTNLQGVLLPILGAERGAGMTAIGLYSSAWSTGFVLGCLFTGRLLGRFGHARTFLMLSLASAGATALLPHHGDFVWIALRLLIGCCFGGLSAIIESWLIERAGGAGFASYMIVNLLASLCGTLSLNTVNPLGRAPFALMIASVALSSLPLLLTRATRPAPVAPFRFALLMLCRRSPLGAAGVISGGLITGAIGGFGPVFGMESGLSMSGNTLMLAANSVGGALAYAPVAMLIERTDRRLLLAFSCVIGLLTCLPLAFAPRELSAGIVVVLFGAFGFAQYPLYGISVGLVSSQSQGEAPAQIASELLLLFGLGTILGPLLSAQFMRLGLNIFVFIACVLSVLLIGAAAWTRSAAVTRLQTLGGLPDESERPYP